MSIKNLIWHLTSVCCTPTRLSYHNISEEWLLMKMINLIRKKSNDLKLCCNGMSRSCFFFQSIGRGIFVEMEIVLEKYYIINTEMMILSG